MPERICPNCGERMTINPTAVPLRIRCPACGGSFTQRPDVQPKREPHHAAGADDLTGPQRATASAGWRARAPSTYLMLAIAATAAIAVGAVVARIAFQAWRNSRPSPTAALAPRPLDARPADRADDGLPHDEADVLDTIQPGIPDRAELTMPDLPEANPVYAVPPAPAGPPQPPAEVGVQLQPQQSQALQAARAAMADGDLQRADDILQSLPGQADNEPDVWIARGDLHSRQGDFVAAADAYQMAVDLDPDEPLYHYVLGNAWYRLGDIEQAISAYQSYIDLKPDTTRSRQVADLVARLRAQPDEP